GHLRRCLNLASELTRVGVSARFVIYGHSDAADEGNRAGFSCELVYCPDSVPFYGNAPDAVVLDSYDFSDCYIESIADSVVRVLIADDDSIRASVDLLVNGAAGA